MFRLTDGSDMTLDVYLGLKTTTQQEIKKQLINTKQAHNVVSKSMQRDYSLKKIFLMVFITEGIVALTIKGR